ncbi:nuclear transport factor 2 family protein [Caulobacter sp.]|uniref:nuclear transport factor 2 family protein n=1 Tax=Caulobacter sp. TaxID=78 RepID=UPI002B46707C|nr:nuclear transport factor 2 family protein [Caulobacter sp.]HJV42116.1 nuclear transport factor 2 family protein [Caulobacter sp.]
MLKTVSFAVVALIAVSPAWAGPTAPAVQIEAAERAFAADGLTLGIRGSFLRHMADDAIVFDPFPVNAKALYAGRSGAGEPKLEWWPAWVVAARSGDLGLSTGPSRVNGKPGGWYATLWRKDADGVWRWIYDGGGAADGFSAPGQDAAATIGPVARDGLPSPAEAFEAVRSAETILAQAARDDAPAAYRAALSADARLLGPWETRAFAPTALSERLALRPSGMDLTLRGGGASRGGDLVWTRGEARWTGAGQKSAAAHYMHVWQKRPEGWRLIFEALINDR